MGDRQPAPIFAAAQGASWRVRDLLEAGADPDARDARGYTALMYAALNGHADSVRLLLEAGADPDLYEARGYTALEMAAQAGQNECLGVLLDAGVSVNGGFYFGRRALHFAAGRGHVSTIQFLLARGANPNQRFGCSPPIGWTSTTPLMTAAFNGQLGAVRALLDGGADPRARRYFLRGIQSAVSSARDGGHREVAELLLLATTARGS